MKIKMSLLCTMIICLLFVSACGNLTGSEIPESQQGTEGNQESESEFWIEIADAQEILLKTWDAYKAEERFKIMGGHFTSAKIDLPAKYDLSQSVDLVQMYCVPEGQLEMIDDAATATDLYNVGRFTVGAYHVTNAEILQNFAEEMKNQVLSNEWHGEKPEKLCVIKVDQQYVVSVYGRAALVDEFMQKLESVYQTMIEVVVEENNF